VPGAIAIALSALSDGDRAAAREAITHAIEPFRTDGGYELSSVCLNAVTS